MADNKIRMPLSSGGLLRYSDESKSKIMIKPTVVVVMIVIVIVIEFILHTSGQALLK